jgi:hypothetical protein
MRSLGFEHYRIFYKLNIWWITNENHYGFIGRASESLLLFVFNVQIQPYNQYLADDSEQKIRAMVIEATYKSTVFGSRLD